MSIRDQLATSLGRRDEKPNQHLAEKIARAKDRAAVKELVASLDNPDKNIQSDCIKVLYEIGERDPRLIAGHFKAFGKLLESKNNRLVWGAMTALDAITLEEPRGVFSLLGKICASAKSGSVIANDHAVGILAKLAGLKPYAGKCFPLLADQLKTCPNNQFPMYSEKVMAVVTDKNRKTIINILTSRLPSLAKESQKNRINKLLKRLASKP